MSDSPKDREDIVLNALTGKLDVVVKFNPDRILTHQYNAAGNKNMIYDPASNTHIEMDPQIVFDNLGNVVVVGN